MKNDRELLEMAAKAAGMDLSQWDWRGYFFCQGYDDECEFWNPLTEDGDALRLAVKLGIQLSVIGTPGEYSFVRIGNNAVLINWCDENEDQYAATRRAIVMAAAEIGRSL